MGCIFFETGGNIMPKLQHDDVCDSIRLNYL